MHQRHSSILAKALGAALLLAAASAGADDAGVNREAFSHLLPQAQQPAQLEGVLRGRTQFRRAWIDGPVSDGDGRGLGPLFNRLSCIACHPANGRGRAPQAADERMQSMLVRLSVPGHGPHGGPKPHPVYGDQLNEEGVPGLPGEGRAEVLWQPVRHALPGGGTLLLRKPRLQFVDMAYGPIGPVLTSPRVGPAVFGLGLLEAVSEDTLRALAARHHPDGVHGQVNEVWDPVARRMAVGRLGWKANTANLQAQVVQAANGDLGLSSDLVAGTNCGAAQARCQAAAGTPQVELDRQAVDDMTAYLRALAPPPARTISVEALRGQALFGQIGCSSCHVPALPLPGGGEAAAYTDLLLHDMGAGLADGRPDYRANGRQWRTAPLWGLGLQPVVNEHHDLLHDGRARGPLEAIAWHDGEARAARLRFERLAPDAQAQLLAFLQSL